MRDEKTDNTNLSSASQAKLQAALELAVEEERYEDAAAIKNEMELQAANKRLKVYSYSLDGQ